MTVYTCNRYFFLVKWKPDLFSLALDIGLTISHDRNYQEFHMVMMTDSIIKYIHT